MPLKTILVTGAAGTVGGHLRRELAGRYALRLADLREVEGLGPDETFVRADMADMAEVAHAVEGVDAIVHLAAYAVEASWERILPANIVGAYNLFEAARRARVRRIVFASSNHAVGFYRRDRTIDHTVYPRPDGRYGLSKVFGEALASLYADKYGAEVLCIRIGNAEARPLDVRRLSIWISPRDLAQLVRIGLEHPGIRFEIVYGMSDNARAWWDNANAHRLGYRPQDRSEDFAAEILASPARGRADAIAEAHQGGSFTTAEEGGDPFKADPA